jgi:hypothetical protein
MGDPRRVDFCCSLIQPQILNQVADHHSSSVAAFRAVRAAYSSRKRKMPMLRDASAPVAKRKSPL